MAEEPQPTTFPQFNGGMTRFAYNLDEVSEATGVSKATLNALIAKQAIPFVRVNKTNVVMTPDQIKTFLNSFAVTPTGTSAVERVGEVDPAEIRRQRIRSQLASRRAAA